MRAIVRPCGCAEIISHADFAQLGRDYAAESALAGLPPPDGKAEAYLALEGSGVFQAFGAFCGDRLVGFAAVIVPVLPHYGAAVAVTESLFVGPEWRRSGAGLALIRATEAHARAAGSPALLVSAPAQGQLARVLDVMRGYRLTNRVFLKELR